MGEGTTPSATGRHPQIPLSGDSTVVRPATKADATLLVEWHADPEISRFWDDEECTRDEVLSRLASPDVDAYIVEADAAPIGYLQAWFDDEVPGSGGLDMFLVPGARGRGLGPDAASALTRHLLANGLTRVTVDPYRSNPVAIRAWAKAGFVEVEHREPDSEHREPWLLMVFDPSRGEAPGRDA